MFARQFAIIAVFFTLQTLTQAQSAEPIPIKKYILHTIVLPFDSRLIGIDEAGDLVGSFRNGAGGFIFRAGDLSIEPWTTPMSSDTSVLPVAMNDRGEVLVSFGRPQNGRAPGHAWSYIYSSKDKTYRPIAFHQQTGGCDGQVIAYNNAGQMFCGSQVASIGEPTIGPVGSYEDPGGTASFSSFSCPDKAVLTTARGENNVGKAVGDCLYASFDSAKRQSVQVMRGFIYDAPTKAMKLFDYPGSTHTTADTITDAGVVLGTYVVGSENGVFTYDGSHFTRLEGTDADNPGKAKSMMADRYMVSSRGEIAGVLRGTGRAFIAVPVGQVPPRVTEALDEKRIAKLSVGALREKPRSGNMEEPNFPGGSGEFRGPGFYLNWAPGMYGPTLNAGVGNPQKPARYVGFNDQGSWFATQEQMYRWNLKSKSLAFLLTELPANLKMPAEPTAASVAQAAASVVPAGPTHGEQGKLTHAPDGNAYLSYVLPGTPPTPMNLKVIRPTNTKPAILSPARIGPGDTGSWVFFGEGAQQAIAALVNLEADGTVTWQFLTPAMAHKYLEQ